MCCLVGDLFLLIPAVEWATDVILVIISGQVMENLIYFIGLVLFFTSQYVRCLNEALNVPWVRSGGAFDGLFGMKSLY